MTDQALSDRGELRTEHLLLRPFELADVDDVFEYAADTEWAKYPVIPQKITSRRGDSRIALTAIFMIGGVGDSRHESFV